MPSRGLRMLSTLLTLQMHQHVTRAAKLIFVNMICPMELGHEYDFFCKTELSLKKYSVILRQCRSKKITKKQNQRNGAMIDCI